MMTLINTKLHGWIDYAFALALACVPCLAGYNLQRTESLVCFATGAFIIVYSLFTNYEMGLLKLRGIPMKLHLVLDVLAGLFLAAAPAIFHLRVSGVPFLCFGIGAIVVALTTDRVAYARLGPDAIRD
jgi:hypothetical protein